MAHVLRMAPALSEKIWGGHRLKDLYNYSIPSNKTGEAWVISGHKNGPSTIVNGEYKGMTLAELFDQHRELFGNIEGKEFPLLIKFIDASDDLSVQVHPDDDYASKYENSLGKTEAWYILDAEMGTDMIVGHHAETKEELKDYIERDDWDGLLNKFPIMKGDFFFIPAGTIHAICAGTLVYEAQQSSDITYRLYDYHRKDDNGQERELHIDQAVAVTKCPAIIGETNAEKEEVFDGYIIHRFVKSDYLSVYRIDVQTKAVIKNNGPFQLLTVIEGHGTINGEEAVKGDNFVICSDVDEVVYEGQLEVMMTTL